MKNDDLLRADYMELITLLSRTRRDDPEAIDGIVGHVLEFEEAQRIAALAHEDGTGNVLSDDLPVLRRRITAALLHPDTQRRVRREMRVQGQLFGWSRKRSLAVAERVLIEWGQRNNRRRTSSGFPERSLADVLDQELPINNEGEQR